MCDIHPCTFLIMMRLFIIYFQFLYTCMHIRSAFVLDMTTCFTISEHGYACLRQHFLSDLFCWLGRLNSGELLLGLGMIPSIHLIHFGHHVPLITSYIKGHLLQHHLPLLVDLILFLWPRATLPSRLGPKSLKTVFYSLYATFPCDKSVYTRVSLYPTHIYVLKHLKKKNFLNYGRRSQVLPVDYLLVPVTQLFPIVSQLKK